MAEVERVLFVDSTYVGGGTGSGNYVTELIASHAQRVVADWDKGRIIVEPKGAAGRVVMIPMSRVRSLVMLETGGGGGKR
jgi:hypothetical protein